MMSQCGNRLARWSLLALAGFWLVATTVQAETEAKPVMLIVTVPANAKVYIDDVATNASGEVRRFISDKVPVGKKYSYKIKGVWTGPDGKDVTREVKFPVTPGIENSLDLTKVVEVPKPVAKLTVQIAGAYDIAAGTKNASIPVKVVRENMKDPIKLTLSGLPGSAKASDLTLPADKSEGVFALTILPDAKGSTSDVTVHAEGNGIKADAKFKLTVREAPPAKLTLMVPPTFDLEAGGEKKVLLIKVKREFFEGPVKVTFTGVPEPLKVSEATIPDGKDSYAMELSIPASAKAAVATMKIKASSGKTEAEAETKVMIKAAPQPSPVKDKVESPKDKTPAKPKDKQ